jgi:hypothetical protein
MTNQNFEQQLERAKQAARQSGISGVAYIYVDPAMGSLKLKLEVQPPECQSMVTSNFAAALVQGSQMLGLRVKTHQGNARKDGGKG